MDSQMLIEICQRLVKLETLIEQHLKGHDQFLIYFVAPMIVALLVNLWGTFKIHREIKNNSKKSK